MRRAVVLGGGSPLGRRVRKTLDGSDVFESAVGIERYPYDDPKLNEGLEFLSWAPDHRPFAEYLIKEEVDTVIDCGLAPDRNGSRSRPAEADVISTMYVGAAISDERSCVRSWVLASSSAFYTPESYMPLLQREEHGLSASADERATSVADAEEYARSVARKLPYVNVAILRLQEIAGGDCRGPLSALLARPVVPRAIGFDPPVQFLHVDDAVDALMWAAGNERAGLYNVASDGLLRWDEAIRSVGHRALPVLPFSLSLLEPLLEPVFDRLDVPFVSSSIFALLRYGMAVDTAKILEAGWRPKADQARCMASLA